LASIIVVADTEAGDARGVQLKERVSASLLDNPHFSSQLIERIGWALADAEEAERASDGQLAMPATTSSSRWTGGGTSVVSTARTG
jgi:hypothetical protein